ncbi:tetratricopeptide repeat protein [Herbidospora mongoliensis]|uniref:tetratricopeptide repeat protein n=1 Tax=Herbidospora mongoliensis TaxID=688067 RepID=UPI000B02B965|nr:hypothetical protein [Herbidospora mongoliensis]
MNRANGGPAAPQPYIGLRAFRTDDAYRFFGRRREAHELADHWRANRLTILHGPSGIGKTSLLQAGVLPLLDPESNDTLPIGRVSYGSAFPVVGGLTYPTAALPPQHNPHVFALLSSWAPEESPTRLTGLTLESFLRGRPRRQDPFGDAKMVLLAIDQAEELFDDLTHRQGFFDQLTRALAADENIKLLISVRDDQLASVMTYGPTLVGTDHRRFRLGLLGDKQAREAAEGPLHGTGRFFDAPALAKLLDDVCESGTAGRAEPVRLQVACSMLWRSLPDDVHLITADHVEVSDETVSALCRDMITEVAAGRLDGDTHRLTVWLARTFVTEQVTRQRVQVREAVTAGMDNAVVDALVRRDILHLNRAGWCELAHDRLIAPILKAAGPLDRSTAGSDPDDLLGAAEFALRDGDLGRAEALAAEALTLGAADARLEAELHIFLGNVAHQREVPEEAITHYRAAALLFETLGVIDAVARLLVAIGRLRLVQDRADEAVDELRAAMYRYPSDLSIQTALAGALWHAGSSRAALVILEDVLQDDGGALDALQTRGEIRVSRGDFADALHDLERAMPLQWPSTKAAHALAVARLSAELPEDKVQEGEKELSEALADAPKSALVHLYAAWIAVGNSQNEVAKDHAESALAARSPKLPGELIREAERLRGIEQAPPPAPPRHHE